MSVTISLARPAGEAPGGLRIPLQLPTGAGALGGSGREVEALRAVAAAVAAKRTAIALEIAKEAKEDLAAVVEEAIKQKDADAVRPVVDEVVRIQGNRSGAPTADELQTSVAKAVGAEPGLVAAAHAQIKDDAVAKAAARWVGVVDAALLERAARAAAARGGLVLVGTPASGLKQLEEKVAALETSLRKDLQDVRDKLKAAGVQGF